MLRRPVEPAVRSGHSALVQFDSGLWSLAPKGPHAGLDADGEPERQADEDEPENVVSMKRGNARVVDKLRDKHHGNKKTN